MSGMGMRQEPKMQQKMTLCGWMERVRIIPWKLFKKIKERLEKGSIDYYIKEAPDSECGDGGAEVFVCVQESIFQGLVRSELVPPNLFRLPVWMYPDLSKKIPA